MTTPVSSSSSTPVGRSPDASLIYQQYLDYYNNINSQINAIVAHPATAQTSSVITNARAKLISLQQALYPIYVSQYNSNTATIGSYQAANASIVSQALSTYNSAMSSIVTSGPIPQSPSPIMVYSSTQSTSTNTTPTTTTTPTTSTTTSTSSTSSKSSTSTTTTSTGRSSDASLIYSQYITYYNSINTEIGAIDQLPYTQRILPQVVADRAKLITLQQQLYTAYTSQYNSSSATISSFQAACAPIMSSVTATYNNALGTVPTSTTTTTPVTTPTTTTTTPTTSTTSTSSTTSTTPTTPTQSVSANQFVSNPSVVENGTWYIDWTSWNYPIPQGVNTVNIFCGNMHLDVNGNPVIDGFGTMSQNTAAMDSFIQACHAKGITVKISIGGSGGSYDNCWDVLTNSNVQGFAQALNNFCTQNGLNGVDFDCEEFTSAQDKPAQQALVGTLIKDFKTLNPTMHTSLCTNAGFGPNYPWQGIVQNILNAATTTNPTTGKSTCAVDRLYIMSYFNAMSDEQGWITGWANWLKANYNFSPSQITVGLNSASQAYNVSAFASWAASQGYSTSYWDYDPGNQTASDQNTLAIQSSYNSSSKAA